MNPEIQKVLVCSTSHLTEDQCNVILPNNCNGHMEVITREYGVMIRIPSVINDIHDLDFSKEMQAVKDIVGDNVMALMSYADRCGCRYLYFDCDAEELEDFPTYSW